MKKSNKLHEAYGESNKAYDEDEKWQLPEAGVMQTAKSYRDRVALPLVDKLKGVVKNLTIQCIQLTEQVKKLTASNDTQKKQIDFWKAKVSDQNGIIEKMQGKVSDLEHLEHYFGREQMQKLIETSKSHEKKEQISNRYIRKTVEQVR